MILKVINENGEVKYTSGNEIVLPKRFVTAFLLNENGTTIERISGNMTTSAIYDVLLKDMIEQEGNFNVAKLFFSKMSFGDILDVIYENYKDDKDALQMMLNDAIENIGIQKTLETIFEDYKGDLLDYVAEVSDPEETFGLIIGDNDTYMIP